MISDKQVEAAKEMLEKGFGLRDALEAAEAVAWEKIETAPKCFRCGNVAQFEDENGETFCSSCVDFYAFANQEVFDHEMREFGGAYGLPISPCFHECLIIRKNHWCPLPAPPKMEN